MAQFRLEDDNQCENNIRKESADQPAESRQLSDARKVKARRHSRHAYEHGRSPRTAHQHQELVNDERNQQNIDDVGHRYVWPASEKVRHNPFPSDNVTKNA